MRVGPEGLLRIREFHQLQHPQGTLFGLLRGNLVVEPHRLHNLRPHGVHGVEGGHRLLEDHGDILAADLAYVGCVGSEQFLTGEPDAAGHPAVAGQEAQEGHGTGALAGTGLPHDGQDFACPDLVVQADGRGHPLLVHAEVDAEIADLKDNCAFGGILSRGGVLVRGDVVSHDAFPSAQATTARRLVLWPGILNY
ncbi:hypothetical protein D9M72_344480 [compost metagenome]